MSDGFPILTTKKVAFKTLVTELKWFLRGDTNIKYLLDNNCHIWDGDAYKNFISKHPWGDDKETFLDSVQNNEKYRHWGELGPIYGKQWRDWNGIEVSSISNTKKYAKGLKQVDQIKTLINELKTNPDSRRLMVSAWNVGDLEHMTLPPCHYSFQCYVVNGKLSLMWNQRSADLFLGVPFNISSYGLLLLLLCKETGYEPGELIGSLGDVHLYKNHIEQAKEQISRNPYKLPTLNILSSDILNGEFEYELLDYKHHEPIKAPLSN
jgi:thymidylate synthase